MAHDASASTGSNHVPVQRAREGETPDAATPVDALVAERSPGPVHPVPLERLLTVAVLTPAQAAHLAVQLLGLRAEQGEGGGAGGRFLVTPDGDLRIEPYPARTSSAAELLEELVDSARRLPAHPRAHQVQLLRRLEEAVGADAQEATVRAAALEGALVQALGPDAPARITRELAALVEAFGHVAPGVPAGIRASHAEHVLLVPAAPATAAPRNPAARNHGPRSSAARRSAARNSGHHATFGRRRAPSGRLALVLLVVALVVVGGGYLVLRGPGSGLIQSLGSGSHPAPAKTPAQHPKQANPPAHKPALHRAVPALAAHHAGAVTGVVLQKTGTCRPGSLCPVKVTVHVKPVSTTRSITWKVGAARLCKRGITWSPATGVLAQPGWNTVYATSSVRVPRGHSLALVALTTSPARAQSRAVPVTRSTLHC